jgi:Ser-tRNA(Ala) deacylase AlaX
MQQHTAQHLITAITLASRGFPTVSWCLVAGDAPCYLDLGPNEEGSLVTTDEEFKRFVDAIEPTVNAHVREGRRVGPRWVHPDDPEMATIRHKVRLHWCWHLHPHQPS